MKNKAALLALLLALCVHLGYAQSRTISGVVNSAETGESLPGVAILEKGTRNGTSTNSEGKFDITVSSANPILVFQAIGMAPKEIVVGEQDFISVQMSETSEQLAEVTISALGFEVPKERIGNASTNVSGELVQNTGESRLIENLSGKSAGLNVIQSTGDPGASSTIQIRGQTSITGNLQPLIVLDGVPIYNDSYVGEGFGGNVSGSGGSIGSGGGVTQQSRLNDLNPNDIESIEVLRGAAAAALWGSRAANGVLVITTKKGRRGEGDGKTFSVELGTSLGFDVINRKVPLQTNYGQGAGQVYLQGAPTGFSRALSWGDKISDRPGGQDTYITDPNDPAYMGYFEAEDGTRYYRIPDGTPTNPNGGKNSRETYDPYESLFQTGITWDKNISVSSADRNGSVYLSLGNLNVDGIVKENSDYDKTTLNLNMTRVLTDKWTVKGGAIYSNSNSNRVQMGSNLNGILLGGLRKPADFDQTDYVGTYVNADGEFFYNTPRTFRNALGANPGYGYDNPLWVIENINSTAKVNRLITKLQLDYEAFNWLSLTLRGGNDFYTDEREDVFDPLSSGENFGGRFVKETITSNQLNVDFIARTKFQLSDDIDFNALLGTNYNHRKFDDQGSDVRQFVNPLSPPQVDNSGLTNRLPFNQEEEILTLGYYGQASFGLFDQLYVNFSGRLDYLSVLPEDNRSVFYPAVDAAWNFIKVLPETNWLSNAKLRVGWGQVGRGPDPYRTRTVFIAPDAAIGGYGEGWGPGVNPSAYGGGFSQSNVAGNPEIRPEIKTEFEVGTDLSFFDNRLGVSFTFYNNTVDDLIIQVDVPNATGFEAQVGNVASLENKGVEIELNTEIIRKENFVWSVYGNWTRNRNKVTDMGGTEYVLLAGFAGTSSGATEGQPVGVIRGSRFARDESNNEIILDANGFPTVATTPGIIGDPNPDWKAGLGSSISYKNFTFDFLWDMSVGGDMWNGTKGALAFFGTAEYTGEETTLSAAEAQSLVVFGGSTVADAYPNLQNSDGSYTVRGTVDNFGGGDVFLDEAWYTSGPGSGFTNGDELFIEDASWFRLREVSLSYVLKSQKFRDWSKLSSMRISLIGRNLLLFTEYSGNDPNQSLSGPANNGFGLDYFQNPSTRTYMIALNLTF